MSNGGQSPEAAAQLYRQRVKDALARADEAFKGEFRAEITALLALSRDDIDTITPDTTDLAAYDALIAVVKEASRINVAQAELKAQIQALGNIAVGIARKVPSLDRILG